MANIATPSFLNSLKAIYPAGGPSTTAYPGALSNPWVIITAVAFSASNVPEAVPVVFKHALEELKTGQKVQGIADDVALKEQLVLARKIREGVLQSGLLSGFPRVSDFDCRSLRHYRKDERWHVYVASLVCVNVHRRLETAIRISWKDTRMLTI